MKSFKSARRSLEGLDAKAVAALLAAASDITLILDRSGVIRDLSVSHAALAGDLGDAERWVGRGWTETMMPDSHAKADILVREARSADRPTGKAGADAPRWRQVNHPGPNDVSIPVLYTTVAVGEDCVVAIGRDQREIAALHRRLLDTQQSMERDYVRLRHAEARYRLLFEMSAEAAIILDAASHTVQESNAAADRLCGQPMTGRPLLDAFDPADVPRIGSMLSEVRFAGRASEVHARLAVGRQGGKQGGNGRHGEGAQVVDVSASPFRQDKASLLLVRLAVRGTGAPTIPAEHADLLRLVEAAPDALVSTDGKGVVTAANAAFLDLAQLEAAPQAVGESLERWLGPGMEFEVLLATLRTRGAVHLFATTFRGQHGTSVEAEVSAGPLGEGGGGYGFAIRDVGPRPAARAPAGPPLPRPVEQLTELVGRVPLKDLVRETTDVIERLAIEAALQLTGDNRASAAEMLGVSRQSLYVKLRRYGLGGDGVGSEEG